MARKGETKQKPWTDDQVRDVSEKIYRHRLGADNVARMIAKDGDDGAKLRRRAGSYDDLTRDYLLVLEVLP